MLRSRCRKRQGWTATSHELRPGQWAVWREFAVRAPGFSGGGDWTISARTRRSAFAFGLRIRGFAKPSCGKTRKRRRTGIARLAAAPAGPGEQEDSPTSRIGRIVLATLLRQERDHRLFFGPASRWGQIRDGRPRPSGCGQARIYYPLRHVRFETWAIEAVGVSIAANPAVRPHVPPHRIPNRVPQDLPTDQMAAWNFCDGVRPARAIASEEVLEALEKARYIRVSFPIAMCPNPEMELRTQLLRLESVEARNIALAILDEFESARRLISEAGNPDELDRALSGLDSLFVRLTARNPSRCAGEHYAARTLVYLDCRRDLHIEIGPAVHEELARILDPLLASTRWFCSEVGIACRQVVENAVAELQRRLCSNAVPLHEVTALALPPLLTLRLNLGELNKELQQRWATLLENSDPVGFGERANAMFADAKPSSGWRWGVWQAPDLQIAAGSVDDINRGDYRVVLGEIHLMNTLLEGIFTVLEPLIPRWSSKAPTTTCLRRDCSLLPAIRLLQVSKDGWRWSDFGWEDVLVMADPDAAVSHRHRGIAAIDLLARRFAQRLSSNAQRGRLWAH